MKDKRMYMTLVLLIPLLITGCWDRKELEGRAIVSLIAIDKGKNNLIEFSVQVVRTTGSQDPNSGDGSSGQNDSVIMSSTGASIFDAIRDLTLKSGRKLYYPHNTAIILGDEIAKEGILQVLDLFNRDAEMRPLTWVVVTPEKAADILEAQSQLESFSSTQLDMMLKDYGLSSKAVATNLYETMKELEDKSSGAVLGNLDFDPNETKKSLLLDGSAVFQGDKLIGHLNPMETRGYLWIKDKVKTGIIPFPCPGAENKTVSIEIKRASSKIKPEISDGKISFTIKVNVQSRLAEQSCLDDLATPVKLDELKKKQCETIKEEIQTTVNKAQQEYDTDIFGFGTELKRKFPNEWQQLENKWPEVFSQAEVNIIVNSEILDVGLIKKPV